MKKATNDIVLVDLPNVVNTFYFQDRQFFNPAFLGQIFSNFLRHKQSTKINIFSTPYYGAINQYIAEILNKKWDIMNYIYKKKKRDNGRDLWEDIDYEILDYIERIEDDISSVHRIYLIGSDWIYTKGLFKLSRQGVPLTCIYHEGSRPHQFNRFQSLRKKFGNGHVKEIQYANFNLIHNVF